MSVSLSDGFPAVQPYLLNLTNFRPGAVIIQLALNLCTPNICRVEVCVCVKEVPGGPARIVCSAKGYIAWMQFLHK